MTKQFTPQWPQASISIQDLPAAFIEIDRDGVIRYVNGAGTKLHDLPAEELLGHRIWEFLPPDEAVHSRAAFQQTIASQEMLSVVRRSLFNLQGEYRIQEFHRVRLYDGQGETAGIGSLIFDVTDLEAAAQAAQKRARWMESILAALPSALVVTDTLGSIVKMNEAAERLTGFTAAEMNGVLVERLISFPAGEGGSFSETLQRECSHVQSLTCKDGSMVEVKLLCKPITDTESQAANGMLMLLEPVAPS